LLLPDHLVTGGMRDQVRESLERHAVAVAYELANRIGERDDLGHRRERTAARQAGTPLCAHEHEHRDRARVHKGGPAGHRVARVILAIDQGTTGTTCLVVDDELRVLGRGYRELAQHFPRPGWVEHDPLEIWESVVACAGDALAGARADARDL